ncbi:hypothetical protein [Guptibacillus hwajinpoensis]|uniref:Uncharacterized protein n=1 Tax=Guptibacillus hwajinpoensis TaxID=208199 RepID=A0ABU0K532_9BACL|nr:hypothetical protein [Alkalihalobacillus hemicentroti]MDQ0483503.1 hypothetical protein [Alkalihalobacillus hemicentroti]
MKSETSYRMLALEKFNAETNWSENNRLFNYSIAGIGAIISILSIVI